MTAGDQRSPLCWPHPLRNQKHPDNHKAYRTDHDDTNA